MPLRDRNRLLLAAVDGRELRLFSTITTFGTPMDITLDEVAVESYYPADDETAVYFTGTATAGPGQE